MIKKLILIIVPLTLLLEGAFVMEKGKPLEKIGIAKIVQDEGAIVSPEPTIIGNKKLGKMIFNIDFNKHKEGVYTQNMLKNDFLKYGSESLDFKDTYAQGTGKALSIVKDGGENVLSILYAKNKIHANPKVGGYTANLGLPTQNRTKEDIYNPQEVTLKYSLKFEDGFDWAIGGKLPGLGGGTAPSGGQYIGNEKMKNGFNARFMWHVFKGKPTLIPYIYHSGIAGAKGKKTYGEVRYLSSSNVKLASIPHDGGKLSPSQKDVNQMLQIQSKKWYTIKQTIKVNTPKKSNGTMKVWINDVLVADFGGMKYIEDGKHGQYNVDRLVFSTFYGGNNSAYAPKRDTHIHFKDIKVYVK